MHKELIRVFSNNACFILNTILNDYDQAVGLDHTISAPVGILTLRICKKHISCEMGSALDGSLS